MKELDIISTKVADGQRIDRHEALTLWREAPLWLLGRLALNAKRAVSGNKVFFNRNFHIEPSNVCLFNCRFCSYRRDEGAPDAWNYSLDQIEQIAAQRKGGGATEVHIVGGVHPSHDLDFYVEAVRRVKGVLPEAAVKAFTAIELSHAIARAGLTVREGLTRLREAGMEAIPGGGAEIFDEALRREICPDKGTTADWFEVHSTAHDMGIDTNATMLYGHIESLEHRIDHLDRIRCEQDRTEGCGFSAFIPLKYRCRNNSMSAVGEVSVVEDMRTLAMSRIYLDNVPHIKSYWVMYGRETAEMALCFGADDLDGTIDDSTKIYSMAGAADEHPSMSVEDMRRVAENAGMRLVERDTHYNEIG